MSMTPEQLETEKYLLNSIVTANAMKWHPGQLLETCQAYVVFMGAVGTTSPRLNRDTIVVIDSCEYIEWKGHQLIHKANCTNQFHRSK